MGLIADLLITHAFVHAFPPGQIDAAFTVDDEAWTLTIDDSGEPIQTLAEQRCDGVTMARRLIARHDGWLVRSGVIGGTSWVVKLPRSMRATFHSLGSAASATPAPDWPDQPKLIEALAKWPWTKPVLG